MPPKLPAGSDGVAASPVHAMHLLLHVCCIIQALLCAPSTQMVAKNPAGFGAVSGWGIAFSFHELCFLGCRQTALAFACLPVQSTVHDPLCWECSSPGVSAGINLVILDNLATGFGAPLLGYQGDDQPPPGTTWTSCKSPNGDGGSR